MQEVEQTPRSFLTQLRHEQKGSQHIVRAPWGRPQPHKQPPAHRQDAGTVATHALPAGEAVCFRRKQNPHLAWTQQGQVRWQALQHGMSCTHGWRCQESSSHSNCLFHPPRKLTWRLQCCDFHSGFPPASVYERCRELKPRAANSWCRASLTQLPGTLRWARGREEGSS